jgi:putative peptidoglycan lipid II flippase
MAKNEGGSIARPAGTVAFFTFLSRILGLVRDMVVAFSFGAAAHADAFFVAFRIPNLLRRLVAEGALTAAFIPVYVEYLENHDPEDAQQVVNITWTLLTMVLTLLTVLGILLSPWIIYLFAPGFAETPAKFDLAVTLNRILFPYIFFVSLVALCMGVLNARGHFAVPAASPILLNIFMISGALVLSRWFDPPILGLAAGVLLGGLSQLLLQIPALRAKGVRIRLRFSLRHPAVRKIARLFLPAAFGAAVYQLNIFVSSLLASFLPEGSISYLWYASRLLEFPLGVFGVALATAAFPSMSQQASRNDLKGFHSILDQSLGLVTFVCLPAMVGLIVLRAPIIEVLFQRGAFDPLTTARTADALFYYCLGLWPIAAGRILVSAFYSLQDTRTPVKISFVAFIGNAVLSVVLMGPMLHCGLALANSISALINMVLLVVFFRMRAGAGGFGWVRETGTRVLFASVLMGVCLWIPMHEGGWNPTAGLLEKVIRLAACVGGGAVVYLAVCRILGVHEYRTVMGVLSRRFRSG